jgi:CheY-like chemotaxis protein
MTGLELAEQARRRYPNLPVVVTSGRACPDLPRETFFLPKPWTALDVIIQAERAVAVAH